MSRARSRRLGHRSTPKRLLIQDGTTKEATISSVNQTYTAPDRLDVVWQISVNEPGVVSAGTVPPNVCLPACTGLPTVAQSAREINRIEVMLTSPSGTRTAAGAVPVF